MKKQLTSAQIEAGWKTTFSTDNPFCPCNLKTFTKAVEWAERHITADCAQHPGSENWSRYVASMVEAYLQSEPAADKREAAITGIIARRVWALSGEHDREQAQEDVRGRGRPSDDKDTDYWMRQFTAARQAEFRLRVQFDAQAAEIEALKAERDGLKQDAARLAPVIAAAQEWSSERMPSDHEEGELMKAVATMNGDWPGCEDCDHECDEPCMPMTVVQMHASIDACLKRLDAKKAADARKQWGAIDTAIAQAAQAIGSAT